MAEVDKDILKKFGDDLAGLVLDAVVKQAVRRFVCAAETRRTESADLAQLLYLDMGFAQYSVKSQSLEDLIEVMNERREPVADAALWLHLDHGYGEEWLRKASAECMRGTRRFLSRSKFDTIVSVYVRSGPAGLVICGEPVILSEDGSSFVLKYPDREKTADAAQFLWGKQVDGMGQEALTAWSPSDISALAASWQKFLCTASADNAWIAFDEGGYRLDLKCASMGRISDLARLAKSLRVCKVLRGTICVSGHGEFGQLITVDRVPVYNGSGFTGGQDCPFTRDVAVKHGISLVESVSFSTGPGIY